MILFRFGCNDLAGNDLFEHFVAASVNGLNSRVNKSAGDGRIIQVSGASV